MKRVLFVANHKGFSKFNAPYMEWFKKQGWIVDNASPGIEVGIVDNQFDIEIQRAPFSLKNIKAYIKLKKIIKCNNYDIIHVHTPMGAFLGRLASIKARKNGAKVVYTAHGFHFFDGAPLKNWVIYYSIEKILARFTDTLVTINMEDYYRAQESKLSSGDIFLINGVGVDLFKFHPLSQQERKSKRQQLGLDSSDFIGLYTAQFIHRKNHRYILEQLLQIIEKTPNFKMLFAGSGETLDECKNYVNNLGLNNIVHFLGGRSDINALCGISDIYISSSIQEGLAIGDIEAMACGCPLLLSNIRGHIEVCVDGRNGFLFNLSEKDNLSTLIFKLANDENLYKIISKNNLLDVKKFDVKTEVEVMAKIYLQLISE